MTRYLTPAALVLAFSLSACGGAATDGRDLADDEEASEPELGKGDLASQLTLKGSLLLSDTAQVELPEVEKYVGFELPAPEGADFEVVAAGADNLETKVVIFGPADMTGFGPRVAAGEKRARFIAPKTGKYLVVPYPRHRRQSGSAALTLTCSGARCFGQCNVAKPTLERRGWKHPIVTYVSTIGRASHSRALDVIARPGELLRVSGKFAYGAEDKDLEDEEVDLWIRKCPGWEKVGTYTTDDDGRVSAELADLALPIGEYSFLWHVPGDGTTAEGTLAIWNSNHPTIVTDIDGTLTTDDGQLFREVLAGLDPKAYDHGKEVQWSNRRKGYSIVYLTGRPQILTRKTREWLTSHGFPPGVVKLTEQTIDVAPTEFGVGDFKRDFLNGLIGEDRVKFFAAYGNAVTDIFAYQAAGIPNDHVFIIGKHAGEKATTAIPSYGEHLMSTAANFPVAVP